MPAARAPAASENLLGHRLRAVRGKMDAQPAIAGSVVAVVQRQAFGKGRPDIARIGRDDPPILDEPDRSKTVRIGQPKLTAAGASIVFAHTGRPETTFPVNRSLDEAVRMIERHRATILWGVAGFVRRVLLRAAELGADFRSVRVAMITGEASSGAMRQDMRDRMVALGAQDTLVVNRYGSTEQGASMVECVEGSGFHSLAPDQVFHEVVDPDTGKRCDDGVEGMLAFTHLNRRVTVFLRYLVGDVVSMSHEACPHCGRTCPRISSQPVRSGDIVKIKGTLVNLQVLKYAI